MHHSGTFAGRNRRHAPFLGRQGRARAARVRAGGAFAPLIRPARRAGAHTPGFVALGAFAALVVVGVVIALLAKVVRPG